ncbi:hypothetical protein FB451DRAFT_1395945 [Mycena latifolia]|nr:hypothetical protein FB451DRAFT_1395945 [Mycena latifolia]
MTKNSAIPAGPSKRHPVSPRPSPPSSHGNGLLFVLRSIWIYESLHGLACPSRLRHPLNLSLAPFSLLHDAIITDDCVRADVLHDLWTFAAAKAIAITDIAPLRRGRPDRYDKRPKSIPSMHRTPGTFAAASEAVALIHFSFLWRRCVARTAPCRSPPLMLSLLKRARAPLISLRRAVIPRALPCLVRPSLTRHVPMPLRTANLCPCNFAFCIAAALSARFRRRTAPVVFAPARPSDLQMFTLFLALRGVALRSSPRAIHTSAKLVRPTRRAHRPRMRSLFLPSAVCRGPPSPSLASPSLGLVKPLLPYQHFALALFEG